MEFYTEYEIISKLGAEIVQSTSDSLKEKTEDELRSIGIVPNTHQMLRWTNVNTLAFHRSALRDEVLEGGSIMTDGRAAPRMRAFAVILIDTITEFEAPVRAGSQQVLKLPSLTRAGRTIDVNLTINVILGSGAKMGEDVMP